MGTELTCRSCRFSSAARIQSIEPGKVHNTLLCAKFRVIANKRCPSFEYEPGTDEANGPPRTGKAEAAR